MPRRRACRSSCSRSRGRRSGSISTSSPRRWTSISRSSTPIRGQDDDQRLGNPVWHIHSGNPPTIDMPVTFAMLLNLASASNAHDKDVLWGFILRHVEGRDAGDPPEARRAGRLRGPLLQRLRRADEGVPRARRGGARGACRARREARGAAGGRRSRGDPERRARRRPRHPALPGRRRARDPTAGRACRSPGSRRSTRCCSARSAGRASARSSRSTASPRRAR